MKKYFALALFIPFFSFATESKDAAAALASPAEVAVGSSENTKASEADVKSASEAPSQATAAVPAAPTSNLTEAEIPVKLDAEKKATASDHAWPKVLGGLIICGSLIFGSVVLVRKYSLKNQKNPMHQIKVVTQYHLGPRKSLAVIRIAGESVLVGVTDHHISLIKSLSLLDGELPETDEVPQNFQMTLNKQEIEGEEFSIQGLQDVVKNKLKSMRNI